jgi:hypothetical protein
MDILMYVGEARDIVLCKVMQITVSIHSTFQNNWHNKNMYWNNASTVPFWGHNLKYLNDLK